MNNKQAMELAQEWKDRADDCGKLARYILTVADTATPALGEREQRPVRDLFVHKKTGGIYEFVCAAQVEADLSNVVVYRNIDSGRTFTRPGQEFWDGRFQKLTPEQAARVERGEPYAYPRTEGEG